MNQLLKFDVMPDGNLKIILTPDGKISLKELIEEEKSYAEIWACLMENEHCNGGYVMISAEEIGALTDAPIICSPDGLTHNDNGRTVNLNANIWWFPDYCVVNELKELLKNKSIIFIKS